MKRMLLIVLLVVAGVITAAAAGSGGKTRRPFIVLAHPGQVVQPTSATDTNLTAFMLFDEPTRELTFTVSEGDDELAWQIMGPAGPGELGAEIAFGVWSPGPISAGTLSKAEAKALRRGQLYLRFIQPSAIPEFPRAMRGQILPVPGVRYTSP